MFGFLKWKRDSSQTLSVWTGAMVKNQMDFRVPYLQPDQQYHIYVEMLIDADRCWSTYSCIYRAKAINTAWGRTVDATSRWPLTMVHIARGPLLDLRLWVPCQGGGQLLLASTQILGLCAHLRTEKQNEDHQVSRRLCCLHGNQLIK